MVKTYANYDIMLIQMGAKYPMGVCGTAAIRKIPAVVNAVRTVGILRLQNPGRHGDLVRILQHRGNESPL